MVFGDDQITNAANFVNQSRIVLNRLFTLAGCLQMPSWELFSFLFPLLQLSKTYEISSLKRHLKSLKLIVHCKSSFWTADKWHGKKIIQIKYFLEIFVLIVAFIICFFHDIAFLKNFFKIHKFQKFQNPYYESTAGVSHSRTIATLWYDSGLVWPKKNSPKVMAHIC